MDAIVWVLLPVFVAAGSALLSYTVMQARMEVGEAQARANLAEAEASLKSHKTTSDERLRAVQEETRRKALDEFLQEIRVEERHYFRENKSASMRRKIMVRQERLYFRNIPLSNWIEHELTVEENAGGEQEAEPALPSVFNSISASSISAGSGRELPQAAGLLS